MRFLLKKETMTYMLVSLFFRGSYSTENTWPYESPSAGYYDITNSTTRLILLNNQKTKVRACDCAYMIITK